MEDFTLQTSFFAGANPRLPEPLNWLTISMKNMNTIKSPVPMQCLHHFNQLSQKVKSPALFVFGLPRIKPNFSFLEIHSKTKWRPV